MKEAFRKLELRIDKLIPYALVIFLIIFIAELFFSHYIEHYSFYISLIDGMVIAIFVADLTFKYIRMHNTPKFLRTYWLEIIAVFPAFLILRIVEELGIISRIGETVQSGLHGAIELERESVSLIERGGMRASRARYAVRWIKPIARLPRLLKAFSFYEHPEFRHP